MITSLQLILSTTKHMAVIDSIIADAISPRSDGSHGLSVEDAEYISNLYLEVIFFVCSIIIESVMMI